MAVIGKRREDHSSNSRVDACLVSNPQNDASHSPKESDGCASTEAVANDLPESDGFFKRSIDSNMSGSEAKADSCVGSPTSMENIARVQAPPKGLGTRSRNSKISLRTATINSLLKRMRLVRACVIILCCTLIPAILVL